MKILMFGAILFLAIGCGQYYDMFVMDPDLVEVKVDEPIDHTTYTYVDIIIEYKLKPFKCKKVKHCERKHKEKDK